MNKIYVAEKEADFFADTISGQIIRFYRKL